MEAAAHTQRGRFVMEQQQTHLHVSLRADNRTQMEWIPLGDTLCPQNLRTLYRRRGADQNSSPPHDDDPDAFCQRFPRLPANVALKSAKPVTSCRPTDTSCGDQPGQLKETRVAFSKRVASQRHSARRADHAPTL